MMRSFFGQQEGDFSLSIRSILALSETPKSLQRSGDTKHIDFRDLEDGYRVIAQDQHVSSFRSLTVLHWAVCNPGLAAVQRGSH